MYCIECKQAESTTVGIKQHILLHKLVDQELASRSQIENSRVFEAFSVVIHRSDTGPRRLRFIARDDGMHTYRCLDRHDRILKALHFHDFIDFCVFAETEVKRFNDKN